MNDTIVVYGRLDDPPIKLLIEALQEANASYVLMETAALGSEQLKITIGSDGVNGHLMCAGQEIALDSIRSVYARPLGVPHQGDSSHRAAHAQAVNEQFLQWLDVAPALVVNRPRAMQANASKPLQAQLIGGAGFLVPPTLVTNDTEEVRAFWREHGRVIYKSVSGVRSIVHELDERTAARLARVSALPTQFQAYVPGVDVRVHVVGDQTFAAEIHSRVTDYRYAAQQGEEAILTVIELPVEVAKRCVTLSRQMELPLTGIDFRRRPDGEFVCFEVNPMPAYSYYETHTGLTISTALARLLRSMSVSPEVNYGANGPSDRKSHPHRGTHPRA